MTIPIEMFYCVAGFGAFLFFFGFYLESKISQVERIFIHIITFLAFLITTGFLLIGVENTVQNVFVAPWIGYTLLLFMVWEFLNVVLKIFRLVKYVIRPETAKELGGN